MARDAGPGTRAALGIAWGLALAGGLAAGEGGSWLGEAQPASTPTLDLGPPEAPAEAKGRIRGHLLLDGRPVADTTVGKPDFWFRHEATNTVPKPEVAYDPGDASFTVAGLAPGKHYVQVDLRRDPSTGMWWPGDLYGGMTFDPGAGEFTVPVWEVIHLVEPDDNARPIPRWSSGCDPKPEHPGPVLFAWEPLRCCPVGTRFEYSVHRIDCRTAWSYGDGNRVASGTTRDHSVRLDLPPSTPDDYYLLVLRGEHEGATVGQLQTRGAAGVGWDYRFRVGPPRAWLR